MSSWRRLVGMGILIEYEAGQTYRTTEKGIQLLYLQNKIDEVAPFSFIKE